MHRDLFSAFLGRYVDESELSLQDARESYLGMESSLLEAWQRYKQSANRVSIAESRKAHPPLEQISRNSEKAS